RLVERPRGRRDQPHEFVGGGRPRVRQLLLLRRVDIVRLAEGRSSVLAISPAWAGGTPSPTPEMPSPREPEGSQGLGDSDSPTCRLRRQATTVNCQTRGRSTM